METPSAKLRLIPAIDRLLAAAGAHPDFAGLPRDLLVGLLRQAADGVRAAALAGQDVDTAPAAVLALPAISSSRQANPACGGVNATGVVLHTNLGRPR
jgi:hypothetical protein